MLVTLILIVLLLIILIINTIIGNKENFTAEKSALDSGALDSGALNSGALDSGALDSGALDSGALDRIDDMSVKIDNLIDQEQETRTFCKLLRHDSTNKEQLEKVMEYRNKQFEDNWKKQNKILSEIKKKIIEVRLGKNDKEFTEFNTDRNKKREEYEKRKKIMNTAKKMIKKPPVMNLSFQNNI